MNISDINDLDFNNIGMWPLPAKLGAIALLSIGILFAGYWFDTKEQVAELDRAIAEESTLKTTFEQKQAVAANLQAYKDQMKEMERSFGALLLKLPSKTEIDALLEDVTRVGVESGLTFTLFKPGSETPKEFYAEYPINLKVTGSYHQLGNFVSGVAALPRIVTIHDFSIVDGKVKGAAGNTSLAMAVTANTYRYLDKDEIKKAKKTKSKN
ncbi:MAG: type 4a pilus biogenesis protein PilO [Gammaproteobacteria bacterium]|nr:type 4a pilus biogenesis protein PilO [Gammaproteobacteria bacterium]MDH5801741.1 type 4a pilus biogenesis protein PilO [Gammaproteobacteria bacterium]